MKPPRRPGNLPARTRQLTSQACRRDISTVHERSSSRRRRMSTGTGAIALSLGLCLCAGQLVATPAATAAPRRRHAAAAAARPVGPSITTRCSTADLAWGSKVTRDRQAHQPEDRQGGHHRNGSPAGVPQRRGRPGRPRTSRHGTVVFSAKPASHGLLPDPVHRRRAATPRRPAADQGHRQGQRCEGARRGRRSTRARCTSTAPRARSASTAPASPCTSTRRPPAQAAAQGQLAAEVRQGDQQGQQAAGDLIIFRSRLLRLPRRHLRRQRLHVGLAALRRPGQQAQDVRLQLRRPSSGLTRSAL